jgi:YD repeat-containing protein
VTGFVNYNSAVSGQWGYIDGNSNPVTLARSVMDYEYTNNQGQLEKLRSCSPANFNEGSPTSYTLTTASGATEQRFNATTGDLERSYTPRQFQSGALGYTAYSQSQIYGVTATVEKADSVKATAGKVTTYSYNATFTRVTMVAMPEDNTNQWTATNYDDRMFAIGTQKPDIGSWGVDPILNITDYDNNGNISQTWQANPVYGGSPKWDGVKVHGYTQIGAASHDRINRQISASTMVDWTQTGSPATLTSLFYYDKNGNRIRSRGPAYDVGGTDFYDYAFAEYDDANRMDKAYNVIASTNASLGTVTGGTPFTQNAYDLLGNVVNVYEPLYSSGSPNYYVQSLTYDWRSRGILTSQNYDDSGPVARTTAQHFAANGALYWRQDGEGFQMWPEFDLSGRVIANHRGSAGGDADSTVYDVDSRVVYYYTYQDVNANSSLFRNRNEYDEMDRLVNSGREEYTGGSWQNWNSNTADISFNWNGQVFRSYDRVNTGKYTEQVYDDWLRNTQTDLPEVANPSGPGNITYDITATFNVISQKTGAAGSAITGGSMTYDVLGRLILAVDALAYQTQTYFDARGLQWKTITPRGAEYTNTYDARGLLTQMDVDHDSTTDTTTYQYDDNGRLYQTNYPDGGITTITYDELGRRKMVGTLLSGSDYLDVSFEYNLNDWTTKISRPGGYETNVTYTDFGQVYTSTDSAGDVTTNTYDYNNRPDTVTQPSGLVMTYSYDWKTEQVSSILYERNASSGDDITVGYTYDDNGRVTTITDGKSQPWGKTYDAMGRMTVLTNPASVQHQLTYDGNSNITKTIDWKGTSHWYQYDALNRMQGHGHTSGANDETYTWNCCNEVSGYTDAFGTAVLTYDDLGRLLSHTDSVGNQVQYDYDELSRVITLTPPQGSTYRTEYQYNANGSLDTVTVYDAGTPADTTYTYDTTSGELLQRDFPTVAAHWIRTAYSYDSAGRLEYQTVTNENGGTTNLNRTQYGYSYPSGQYVQQTVRTEQTYSGGWVDDNRVTYKTDSLGRLQYEEREDWSGAAWVSKYSITQTYDKNGNRTGYNKSVSGSTADYGITENLSYTFNSVNGLTAITDSVETRYTCVVTCDANNNITQLDELMTGTGTVPPFQTNHLYSIFEYDDLNRQTKHKTKAWVAGGTNNWVWVERQHEYSAVGALVRSGWRTYPDGTSPGAYSSSEHAYDQQTGNFVQNVATSGAPPAKGTRWVWAGAQNAGYGNLFGPNSDTASQDAYTVNASGAMGGANIPNRRTFINPSTQGNKRELWGQGRPLGKDSVAAWSTGTISQPANNHMNPVTSRLVFEGTVTATDLSRVTDMREKGRIGIFGTGFSYAGSYGRVTSETLGRDLNPLGRGDGIGYVGGGQNIGRSAQAIGVMSPSLPTVLVPFGTGNSVNNLQGGSNDCIGCCPFQVIPPGPSTTDKEPCLDRLNDVKSEKGCSSPCNEDLCHEAICKMMECLPHSFVAGRYYLPDGDSQYRGCHCKDRMPSDAPKQKIGCIGCGSSGRTGLTQGCIGCAMGSSSFIISPGKIRPIAAVNDGGQFAQDCDTVFQTEPIPGDVRMWFDRARARAQACLEAWIASKQNDPRYANKVALATNALKCLEARRFSDDPAGKANMQYGGCCCREKRFSGGYAYSTCCSDPYIQFKGGSFLYCPSLSPQPRPDAKIVICADNLLPLLNTTLWTDDQKECRLGKLLLHECFHSTGLGDSRAGRYYNDADLAAAEVMCACCPDASIFVTPGRGQSGSGVWE